jgi:Methyltransferase domain
MGHPVFDEELANQLESVYRTRDILRRRRLVREALAAAPGERILDVGCGPGFYVAELLEEVGDAGSVVGADASPQMLAVAGGEPRGTRSRLPRGRRDVPPRRGRRLRRRALGAGARVRPGRGPRARRAVQGPPHRRPGRRLGRGLDDHLLARVRHGRDGAGPVRLGRASRAPGAPADAGRPGSAPRGSRTSASRATSSRRPSSSPTRTSGRSSRSWSSSWPSAAGRPRPRPGRTTSARSPGAASSSSPARSSASRRRARRSSPGVGS